MNNKQNEIYQFIRRRTLAALKEVAWNMDGAGYDFVKKHSSEICVRVADDICENYRMMELADIFEWKRTRIRGR